MKSIKTFIKGLLDARSSLSSKRFISILLTFLMAFAIIMDILYKKTLTQYMWDGLLLFVGALLGMNTALSFKALNVKENVSTDIIKEDPSVNATEQAQETLTSDRPA